MTKRQEQALKTREKILKEAKKMVTESGLFSLNIDVLTERCGVAKGTFYTYFKSRNDIVLEICSELFAKTEARMRQMTDKNVIEKLSYYFDEYIGEVERYGINLVRAWIKEAVEPVKRSDNNDRYWWRYEIEMLESILETAVKTKELKKNTPVEFLSRVIISQLFGIMMAWCISDGEFSPKEWTKQFCDVQLKAILEKYMA